MSADGQGGAGRREVAYRLFATEFDDATLEHSDSDEERAPNYVVTPTGARVNRLFVVGVLTEVESVSDDVLRARVVDPTGAFVVYAGQYQPDAMAFLDGADVPSFVAVTGKARTYQPEGSDRIFTSIRPETTNAVDADTRDRWTIQTAQQTLERVQTMAAALEQEAHGEALTDALGEVGVDDGLAAGIPLAIGHYGTTPSYLAALRRVAIQAAKVVAGERDEVDPLAIAPDEDGDAAADLDALAAEIDLTGVVAEIPDARSTAGGDTGRSTSETDTESTSPGESTPDRDAGLTPDATPEPADSDGPAEMSENADGETADAGTDDGFELDEDERDQIEDEYGTEFQAGSEVDEPGQANIETASEAPAVEATSGQATGDTSDEADPSAASTEATGDVESDTTGDDATSEPPADPEIEPETMVDAGTEAETGADEESGEPEEPEDLEAAVVTVMRERDDGDGADRAAVIDAVATEYEIDADVVEDAIQEALMAGKCYEPGEGRLKAI